MSLMQFKYVAPSFLYHYPTRSYSQFNNVSKRYHFDCCVLQYISADQISERAPSGCYISGLYLEGAMWNKEAQCLQRPLPKVLIEELPILRIIPIEAHRLKLQVRTLLSLCIATTCTVILKSHKFCGLSMIIN